MKNFTLNKNILLSRKQLQVIYGKGIDDPTEGKIEAPSGGWGKDKDKG